MKCLILAKNHYDFMNGDSRVSGNKISYLIEDKDVEGTLGHAPLIVNVDDEIGDKVINVPGLYDLDFTMKTGKMNKPEVVLKKVTFIKDVEIVRLFK